MKTQNKKNKFEIRDETLIDTLNRFWKEDGYMSWRIFALTELIASNIDADLPVMKCDSKDKKHRMVQKNE